jgi:hypothetical protein
LPFAGCDATSTIPQGLARAFLRLLIARRKPLLFLMLVEESV